MKLEVFEGQKKVKDIEMISLFLKKSEQALYQAAVGRMTHERQGNAFTKTKSEVRGGGKKPWKQKGLGRARAGSSRSPLWRGGGVTFGPRPRDFSKKVNKNQRNLAYQTVFNKLAELSRVKVFSDVAFDTHKTKDFLKTFKDYIGNGSERVVIILPEYNKNIHLASRNMQHISVIPAGNLDILPLIHADWVWISEKATQVLETKFAKRPARSVSGADAAGKASAASKSQKKKVSAEK